MCRYLQRQPCSLPDLEGPGFRASTMEEKINDIYIQLPLFMQNAAWTENCVQTLAQTVATQTAKIANVEQIVGSLVARVTSLETNAASGSSSPDSTRSWNVLGHSGSSDDTRNTRRRLDTFSSLEDEQPRDSLANNTTKGLQSGSIIFGKNPKCQHTTNLSEFIAKQVPCQSGLFLKHEPNVKT